MARGTAGLGGRRVRVSRVSSNQVSQGDAIPLHIGVFGARGVPSTYGGFETFLTFLLPELVRMGHSVTVYCREEGKGPLDDYSGVTRRRAPYLRRNSLETFSHGLTSAALAVRARHDVVLVCNVANVPATAVLRALGTPVVLNTDGQEWLRGKWSRLWQTVFRGASAFARHSATALVSDCNGMAEVYRNQFNADSTVIPYAWAALDGRVDRSLLSRFELSERSYFVIGGRHVPENNLAEIAAEFSRSGVSSKLVILGSSTYPTPVTEELRALAQRDQRLVLLGHVGDRDMYRAIMASSLLYLHGHSVGGMNPALVEAMGMGCAIAANDVTFNREVLGNTGWYFTLGTGAVAELVARVERAPEAMDDLRRIAAIRAKHEYDGERVVAAYERILRQASTAPRFGRVAIRTEWDARGR